MRNESCTARPEKRAFTLLELVMVITLLAVLMGTIVPSLKPILSGSALKHASTALSDRIRYARSVAIERGGISRLTWNPETNTIELAVESDPLNAPGQFFPEPSPVREPESMWDNVTIAQMVKNSLAGSMEENVITFNPDGTTSDTFIYLVDDSQRVYTVGIVGLTGQVILWNRAVESFYDS